MNIIFLALASIIFCFLIGYLPSMIFFLVIFWGTALIISSFYLNQRYLLILYGINISILYLYTGISNLFFYMSFFGIAVLVMSLLAQRQKGYYDLQKWGVTAAVLGVSLFLGVLYFTTGDIGISQMEQQLSGYIQDTIQYYEENGLFELYESQGITRADIEKTMYSFAKTIAKHLPAIYYLQAILVVFFMLLFASWASLKNNLERLNKKPYSEEIMPWQLVWIVILGLLLCLIGREKMSYLYYVGSNILVLLVPISIYFGLSALIFKFKQRKSNSGKWIILLLVVAGIIFPLSAIIFLCLLGLFDALLDSRKLRIE